MRTRLIALAAGAALVPASAFVLAGSASAADDSMVTVVHAVPGLTVDVYANDQPLLKAFAPGTVTDPLTVPAGDYNIEIFPAGQGPDGTPAIQKNVTVPAGANASVVAHLDAAAAPTMTVYVNDTSAVPAGQARVTVRHDAAAPAVDVLANGNAVFTNLSNPNQATGQVPAGTYSVEVVATGTTTPPVIGPAPLEFAAGSNTIIYAWGSLEAKNLGVLTQSVTGMGAAPHGVPSGTGGMADDGGFPLWAAALVAVGAVGAVASGARIARTRSQA